MELDKHIKQKVALYHPSAQALAPIRDIPMLFLVGITGAGKNTILNQLLKKYPNDYHFIVSHTTRAPRENNGVMEQEGVEYHFVDMQQMDTMLDQGAYIEVQPVHTHIYGTSVAEVMQAGQEGKIAITDIDIKGADYCVGLGLNTKPIFVLPPNYDVWFKRYRARYGGDVHGHDFTVRVRSAISEIEHAMEADYFYIVVNEDLDKTVELVNQIAHGEPVEPHYHKAMDVAGELLERLRMELAQMV